jgi:hypothetical protein
METSWTPLPARRPSSFRIARVIPGQTNGQWVKKKLTTLTRPSRSFSVTGRPAESIREKAGMDRPA